MCTSLWDCDDEFTEFDTLQKLSTMVRVIIKGGVWRNTEVCFEFLVVPLKYFLAHLKSASKACESEVCCLMLAGWFRWS